MHWMNSYEHSKWCRWPFASTFYIVNFLVPLQSKMYTSNMSYWRYWEQCWPHKVHKAHNRQQVQRCWASLFKPFPYCQFRWRFRLQVEKTAFFIEWFSKMEMMPFIQAQIKKRAENHFISFQLNCHRYRQSGHHRILPFGISFSLKYVKYLCRLVCFSSLASEAYMQTNLLNFPFSSMSQFKFEKFLTSRPASITLHRLQFNGEFW